VVERFSSISPISAFKSRLSGRRERFARFMVVSSDFHGEVGVRYDGEKPDSDQRRPRHSRPPPCTSPSWLSVSNRFRRSRRSNHDYVAGESASRGLWSCLRIFMAMSASVMTPKSRIRIKGAHATFAHPLACNVAGLQSRARTAVPGGSGAYTTRGARPGGPLAGGTSPAAAVHAQGKSARSLRSKAPAPPSPTPLHATWQVCNHEQARSCLAALALGSRVEPGLEAHWPAAQAPPPPCTLTAEALARSAPKRPHHPRSPPYTHNYRRTIGGGT
jgi:hypothetical protein